MIGIDFDNTIVCYDPIFLDVAVDRGLVPENFAPRKEQIRDLLRQQGREDDWTELQGYVYGKYIDRAKPFPGVHGFLSRCREGGASVAVVSHKTKRPFRGPAVDLRSAAKDWLRNQSFLDPSKTNLTENQVFFEKTAQAKQKRIIALGCDVFIDDLPEFLATPGFPESLQKVLFDPTGRAAVAPDVVRCRSWPEIAEFVFQS